MEAEARRPAQVEPAGSLWTESGLIGVGVGLAVAGIFTLPTLSGRWPAWYVVAAALLPLPLSLGRRLPRWAPVASAAIAATPTLIDEWVWWMPILAGAMAGSAAFGVASVVVTSHHRGLLDRAARVLEWITQRDINGDGQVEQPRTLPAPKQQFVYVYDPPSESDARWEPEVEAQAEARLVEQQELDAKRDLGYVVDKIWAPDTAYRLGTDSRTWERERLPSGVRMSRRRWQETMALFERANLVRRGNESSRAPYVVRATREQALHTLRDAIILPGEPDYER